jgi:hypothetical protein
MPIPNRAALRPVSALARVLCVLGVLLPSSAPRAALEEGKNFDALVPPQPTSQHHKIEVIEFFSYSFHRMCCFAVSRSASAATPG